MDLVEAFNQSGFFAKLSLLLGFVPLGFAIAYAIRPAERTLAVMRPISLASIFAAISGVSLGGIIVLMGIAATDERPLPSSVYAGVSESLVPAFVNFGILSASWLLVAVTMMRRARLE